MDGKARYGVITARVHNLKLVAGQGRFRWTVHLRASSFLSRAKRIEKDLSSWMH